MKKRRIASIVLAMVLVLTMMPGMAFADDTQAATQAATTTTATKTFTDISSHWGKTIIQDAAERGIVNGYLQEDGTYLYKPDNLMKREEFFTLVVNVLSKSPDTSLVDVTRFCDVLKSDWYANTVAKAVAAGITNGTTTVEKDGYASFGVGLMITRQEAAKIISSIIDNSKELTYDQMKSGQDKYNAIKDKSQIASWASEHVEKLFVRGYMQGAANDDGSTSFNPTSALTRAEAATLLLNVVKNESKILGPKQNPSEVPATNTTDTAVATGTAVTTGTAVATVSATSFASKCGVKSIDAPKSVEITGSNAGCDHEIFKNGTGRYSDPYVITTPEQLNHIRDHIGEGAYFVLANDIRIRDDYCTSVRDKTSGDWTNGNFEPIGTVQKLFDGHIDGNGYTISGLIIKGTNDGAAFIAYLGDKGSITNLTIDDTRVEGAQYAAAFVGFNEGEVSYCTAGDYTQISGSYNVGGIIGYSKTGFENCENKAEIVASRSGAGGIAGTVFAKEGTVKNCINKGLVSGTGKVGGIIGSANGYTKPMYIENCTNKGKVSASESVAGGIVGEGGTSSYEVSISYCLNEGTVGGNGINGGVAGYVGREGSMTYCYNTGETEGSGSGGVAGSNDGKIKFCANAGKVTSKNYSGGIVGVQQGDGAITEQCYNIGVVTSNNSSGGIIGDNYKKVRNCYNTGDVQGSVYSGGIIGKNNGTVSVAYSIGKITSDNIAGQIAGVNKGTCEYVYWAIELGEKGIAQSDTQTTQNCQRALTLEKIKTSTDISVTSTIKGKFADVLNLSGNTEYWGYGEDNPYPILLGTLV